MNYNLITILGPTAVGKTRLAAELAFKFSGEIISADSRQVYKKMDIGTGKDLNDYLVAGNRIPYHLIDVIEPSDEFNLFLFNKLFYDAFLEINNKNKIPILTGGTGLFLHSILKQYELHEVEINKLKYAEYEKLSLNELCDKLKVLNSNMHNTTDLLIKERVIKAILIAEDNLNNKIINKPEINSFVIGVKYDREIIKDRITKRLKERLKTGMIEEVEKLLNSGITFDKLNFFGLEYKFVGLYLKGELNYNDMYQKLNSSIHAFAKRQMTWFRKMEKEGIHIQWIEGPDVLKAAELIEENYFNKII
ncbi:MAG: tRNA (adenosine(37)-N6)-dimethylallyltransferase MiaA [Bacteroidetes bacterium]|nr:tRNA (adenosine(37)-N6)-dimethylallyltransferase MiaA [Bacteroidota bacterium]